MPPPPLFSLGPEQLEEDTTTDEANVVQAEDRLRVRAHEPAELGLVAANSSKSLATTLVMATVSPAVVTNFDSRLSQGCGHRPRTPPKPLLSHHLAQGPRDRVIPSSVRTAHTERFDADPDAPGRKGGCESPLCIRTSHCRDDWSSAVYPSS